MSAPLELTGLTKVFPTPTGPFVAVKDVNAEVIGGEFVAILGPSGFQRAGLVGPKRTSDGTARMPDRWAGPLSLPTKARAESSSFISST
jgi:ABC-type dipeptide/oligopeptide/nickel transport system ATPase subunit